MVRRGEVRCGGCEVRYGSVVVRCSDVEEVN